MISASIEETMNFAAKFASQLKPGDIVFLKGNLGAGKTVFAKGIARGLGIDPELVSSPTFVLMNFYFGRLPLYHFDLYRLELPYEIESLNLDEYFYGEGVCLVEWPQRLGELIPSGCQSVELTHIDENRRSICIV